MHMVKMGMHVGTYFLTALLAYPNVPIIVWLASAWEIQ